MRDPLAARLEPLLAEARALAGALERLGAAAGALAKADLDRATALRRPLGRAAWLLGEAAADLHEAARQSAQEASG